MHENWPCISMRITTDRTGQTKPFLSLTGKPGSMRSQGFLVTWKSEDGRRLDFMSFSTTKSTSRKKVGREAPRRGCSMNCQSSRLCRTALLWHRLPRRLNAERLICPGSVSLRHIAPAVATHDTRWIVAVQRRLARCVSRVPTYGARSKVP